MWRIIIPPTAVREWVNELAEVRIEVDRDMVCSMRNLTCNMGHVNVGVLSVAGAGAPGVSVGVGWSGEREEGASKEKGKGKERAEDEGEGAGEGWGGSDDWTEGGGERHDDGCGGNRCGAEYA